MTEEKKPLPTKLPNAKSKSKAKPREVKTPKIPTETLLFQAECRVNLRAKPDLTANVVRVVAKNEQVEALAVVGLWVKTKEGYILKDYLTKVKKKNDYTRGA